MRRFSLHCVPRKGLSEYKKVMEFTAVVRKVPEGYIAFVEELPGANTQAATLGEARQELKEAVMLVLEANHTLAEKSNL